MHDLELAKLTTIHSLFDAAASASEITIYRETFTFSLLANHPQESLSHITILHNQHASKADCLCSQPGRGAAAQVEGVHILYKLFRQTVRLESGILCLFVCEVEIICKDLKNRYFTLKIIGFIGIQIVRSRSVTNKIMYVYKSNKLGTGQLFIISLA